MGNGQWAMDIDEEVIPNALFLIPNTSASLRDATRMANLCRRLYAQYKCPMSNSQCPIPNTSAALSTSAQCPITNNYAVNARQVRGPTTPSAAKLRWLWNALTATSVNAPKLPSARTE
jgi:hypothetical protein